MVSNNAEMDVATEHGATVVSDSSRALVSDQDLATYSVNSTAKLMGGNVVSEKELNFTQHPISGYDACAPDYMHYDGSGRMPNMTEKGWAFSDAAHQALNSPEKQAPSDLSKENKDIADGIAKVALDYKNVPDDFSKPLDGTLERQEHFDKIQEFLDKVAPKDMERILADVNKNLKEHGLRIEQVPSTKEIWLGNKSIRGDYVLSSRLKAADCNLS